MSTMTTAAVASASRFAAMRRRSNRSKAAAQQQRRTRSPSIAPRAGARIPPSAPPPPPEKTPPELSTPAHAPVVLPAAQFDAWELRDADCVRLCDWRAVADVDVVVFAGDADCDVKARGDGGVASESE